MFGLLLCVVEIVCLIWQWRDVIFFDGYIGFVAVCGRDCLLDGTIA